jgi:hypothetical protein
MRKGLLILLFSVTCAATAMAQGIGASSLVYSNNAMVVDPHGNLLIFDTSYALSSVVAGIVGSATKDTVNIPVTLPPVRQLVTPSTKITVIPGGTGKPVSMTYTGTFEIVGTGKWGLYAIATAYTNSNNQLSVGPRKLIAIDPGPSGTGLPTQPDLSGFLSTPLNNGDVKLNASTGSAPDILYNLQNGMMLLTPLSAISTATALARVERTITFDGTRFTSTDIPLP